MRRAYRKAALKYHPDKAAANCRFSTGLGGSSGSSSSSLPLLTGPDLEARVREESAWLFNLITHAQEELGDKASRRKVGGFRVYKGLGFFRACGFF